MIFLNKLLLMNSFNYWSRIRINSIWQFYNNWAIVLIYKNGRATKNCRFESERIVKNAWTTYIENDKITNPWPFWWSCIEIIIKYYHYNNIIIIIIDGNCAGIEKNRWIDESIVYIQTNSLQMIANVYLYIPSI